MSIDHWEARTAQIKAEYGLGGLRGRGGGGACSRWHVTCRHFITLSARATVTTLVIWWPWEEKTQSSTHWLQVSAAWAYVPFGVWPVHVNTKWTQAHTDSTMNAASPDETTFPVTHWAQTFGKPCPWCSSVPSPLDYAADLILLGVRCNLCHCSFEENLYGVDVIMNTYCISLTLSKHGLSSLHSWYLWAQATQASLVRIMSCCWLMMLEANFAIYEGQLWTTLRPEIFQWCGVERALPAADCLPSAGGITYCSLDCLQERVLEDNKLRER